MNIEIYNQRWALIATIFIAVCFFVWIISAFRRLK
jgi:hypothetical protein